MSKSNLDNESGSINDYNKSIELDPNVPAVYAARVLAKLRLGLTDSACLDFSKAGELGLAQAYEMIREYCN